MNSPVLGIPPLLDPSNPISQTPNLESTDQLDFKHHNYKAMRKVRHSLGSYRISLPILLSRGS